MAGTGLATNSYVYSAVCRNIWCLLLVKEALPKACIILLTELVYMTLPSLSEQNSNCIKLSFIHLTVKDCETWLVLETTGI